MKYSLRLVFVKETFIVRELLRHRELTRDELSNLWLDSVQSDGCEFERTTFWRYINSIREIFDIRIEKKRWGKQCLYYIVFPEDVKNNKVFQWSLSALTMGDALIHARKLSNRIILEKFPSENGRLLPILSAMEKNNLIDITYQKYNHPEPCLHTIAPYCIKQYRQRLYVVGMTEANRICPFSLDRITEMNVSTKKFKMPVGFDAEEYFATAFGVMVDGKPETIVLRAFRDEPAYLKDVPVHHSQKLMHEDTDHADFSVFLSPTNDFIGQVLSRGDRLRVISPQWLADEVRKRHLDSAI